MTQPADVTVSFNFNALHVGFSARIGQILERATLALTSVAGAQMHGDPVPGVQLPHIGIKLQTRALEEVRPETATWIVACAFRDWIEETAGFLEATRRTCAAVLLSDEGVVTSDRFVEVVEQPRIRFDRRNFPDKMAELRRLYGADILDPRAEMILTLNQARNCLVHRLGVVSDRDCDEGQDALLVRWQTITAHVRKPDGEDRPITSENPELDAGDSLVMKDTIVERRYEQGQRLMLSTADLCGIWHTLNGFGVFTAKRVCDLAESKGFVFTPPES